MENKQTAVELLFEKLWDTPKDKLTWNAILEQSKQMEKEQIIESFKHGELPPLFVNYNAEEYYKENYGN